MQLITGINDNPSQIISIAIPDGTTATMTLSYRPNQSGWYFNLSWNGQSPAFVINSMRVTTYPNILNQYRTLFSFGLACVTSDGYEPLNAEDFKNGYANLYLLTSDEVVRINTQIFVGK
jgi:hypothetical protein